MATTALLGIQFATPLVAIFRDDPKVITIGTLGLLGVQISQAISEYTYNIDCYSLYCQILARTENYGSKY